MDRCWFLWSLSGNVVGFGVGRSAVEVCDFGLDRRGGFALV